jgi:hypothetical protein
MPDTPDHYRLPRSQCPHCGQRLNAAIAEGLPKPAPGDLSVCIGCGEAVQFGPKLSLKRVPPRVLALLLPEERADLDHVQSQVRAMLASE